jgi:predicted nucleic acid-binding Zn ribbon protein
MEVVHGIHGHGPETCSVCGGRMRKAFVAPAVHFKGSGWAKKDRGAVSSTKAAKATAAGEEGPPGGAGSSGGATGSKVGDAPAAPVSGAKPPPASSDGAD